MLSNFLAGEFEVYTGFTITFAVLLLLSSIFMIVIVLMQRGTDNNMSAIMGGSDTFFGRNKSRSIDGKFKLATAIIAASMLVFSILFFVFFALLQSLG